jgi:hypothetical protein
MSQINEQTRKVEAEVKKLEAMGGSVSGRARQWRDSAFARFPVVFVLLSTFGLVATFYGFEKLIDQIDFFADQPLTILLAGLITLTITGTLYKRLS